MPGSLHIVCLDAPAPPNYGGTIDLYYKVPALHAQGWRIHLHYFAYHPGRDASGLEPYCESIQAYGRSGFLGSLLTGQPYIVVSRCHRLLIERLNEDDAPVLLEGIHCTGLISSLRKDKKVHVRVHNDEARYYARLAKTEKSFFKRLYLNNEAGLLAGWQRKLPVELSYSFVSAQDEQRFRETYGMVHTKFVPVFLPWQEVVAQPGLGEYALYHGNLEISENRLAAEWLAKEIFADRSIPFVVAGKSAASLGSMPSHVRLVNSPSEEEMQRLIRDAQVHVLPSFNETGLKLKLLNALFNGRHCLVNQVGVAGSGLEGAVCVAEGAAAFREQVRQLMQQPFDASALKARIQLIGIYDNRENARMLSELL